MNPTSKRLPGQSGQVAIEYVLTLVVAVGLAALITRTMISRDPDNAGFLIRSWSSIIEAIGKDKADGLQ